MASRWPGARDSGATAVETAFVLPILILIVFGIIEFGVLFNRLQGVHAASRESARLASLVGVELDAIQTRSVAAAPPFVREDDLQVTVTRILVASDGTTTEPESWTFNPASGSWSGGTTNSGAEVPCDETVEPDPPTTLYIEVNVRVDLELLNPGDYGVSIPLFGSFAFAHPSTAEFRCEF